MLKYFIKTQLLFGCFVFFFSFVSVSFNLWYETHLLIHVHHKYNYCLDSECFVEKKLIQKFISRGRYQDHMFQKHAVSALFC